MKLVMKNPLAGDDVGAEGTWNKVPRVVGEQGTILLFHRSAPIGIGEGAAIGLRNRREDCGGVRGRLTEAGLATGSHPMLVNHRCNGDSTR